MQKGIIISEEIYFKMLENYDKAITELEEVRQQLKKFTELVNSQVSGNKVEMNNLTKECIEYISEEMEEGKLADEDRRLACVLSYLANDEDINGLYELIKTGKAPGAGKQSGAKK